MIYEAIDAFIALCEPEKGDEGTPIEIEVDEDMVRLTIGCRDLIWDRHSGEFVDSGMMLGMTKEEIETMMAEGETRQ